MGIDRNIVVDSADGPTEETAVERHLKATRNRRRIMVIFGSRAEVIKLAPIEHALRASEHFEALSVTTGRQHEQLDQVLGHFSVAPAFDLAMPSTNQSLTDITAQALCRLTPIVQTQRPDAIVVQGDSTTAMAGALVAYYERVPVVHVEAGLRSAKVSAFCPEGVNRKFITQLASLHLAPTEGAKGNLLREGVDPSNILVSGNTVIDSLFWSIDNPTPYGQPDLDALEHDNRRMILVTAHGRESGIEAARSVGRALASVARSEPGIVIVAPVGHDSPVSKALAQDIAGLPNVIISDVLPYAAFVRLINRSDLIVTDSGGLQEEGPTLGKPVLVTADSTDRPEAAHAGGVRLVGTDALNVASTITKLLHDSTFYASMAVRRSVYGDGRAAERSVDAIAHMLGLGPAPEKFFRTTRKALSV